MKYFILLLLVSNIGLAELAEISAEAPKKNDKTADLSIAENPYHLIYEKPDSVLAQIMYEDLVKRETMQDLINPKRSRVCTPSKLQIIIP